jgi:hypothetical protein
MFSSLAPQLHIKKKKKRGEENKYKKNKQLFCWVKKQTKN